MLPEHTKHQLLEWVRNGNTQPHGSFLTALVSNKLMEAFHAADDINFECMQDIVRWMYEVLPVGCYGSVEKFEHWTGMPEQLFNNWKRVRGITD